MLKMTLRECYENILIQFKIRNGLHFDSEDQLNRAANISAVKNTAGYWRRQWKSTK